MRPRLAKLLLCMLALYACATPEVLESRDPSAPNGIDFSGYWSIRKVSEDDGRRMSDSVRRATNGEVIPLPSGNSRRSVGRTRSSRRGQQQGQVQVFLENGELLKITQTADGMFVSFDRSVVEEFRFGENRIISIGEITAQRVSGWEGRDYVVETLDKGGMKLTERLTLLENGQVLRRHIVFRDREMQEVTMEQMFDRRPG